MSLEPPFQSRLLDGWYRVVDRFTAWRVRWFGTHTVPPIEHCDWCEATPAWVYLDEDHDAYACPAHRTEDPLWQPTKRGKP